jgi:hypothetical protein
MAKKFKSFNELISEKGPFTSTSDQKSHKDTIVSVKDSINSSVVYDGGHGEYKRYGDNNSKFITKRKKIINDWKIFIKTKAGFFDGRDDFVVIIGKPQETCSFSFLLVYDEQLGRPWTLKEIFNIWKYMTSKTFKYLLMLTTKGGQDAYRNKYKYIPVLDWNSEIFNSEDLDEELYKLFKLDKTRIESWYSTLRPSSSLTKYIWDEKLQEPVLVTELVADPSDDSDEVEDEEPTED